MNLIKLGKRIHTGRHGLRGGFTLLEIMVVVIIIGTIAGLVGVKVLARLEEARINAAKAQMSSIKSSLDLFKMDNGFYPPTQPGLNALVGGGSQFGSKGYLNSDIVPMDPWQSPYQYVSDGSAFTLWSNGPDRMPQTGDDIPG
jgi:general secretion pathway protein G